MNPQEGHPWGTRFLHASAGKVVGLRTLKTGLRGFGRRAGDGVHREEGREEGKPSSLKGGSKHSDQGSTDFGVYWGSLGSLWIPLVLFGDSFLIIGSILFISGTFWHPNLLLLC